MLFIQTSQIILNTFFCFVFFLTFFSSNLTSNEKKSLDFPEYLNSVYTAPKHSFDMLTRLHDRSRKQLYLLNYQKDELNKDFILSAQLRASVFLAHTNTPNKFGYIGRFPTNYRGSNATVADINDFTIGFSYSPLSWIHAYWEFLHSDQITFTTDPRQGTNHTQKVYVSLGNFNHSPFYLTIGKKDIGFGEMYTVNPFSPSTTWHYFGALSDGIAFGYFANGFHIETTLINGGRGIRVVDTNEKGKLDNWAINGSYECSSEKYSFRIGGGFLYSTMYDGSTAEHTGPVSIGPRNGAWNVNIQVKAHHTRAYFEVTSTEKTWPITMHKVQTFASGISYEVQTFEHPLIVSIEYSEGIQGEESSEFRRNGQAVLGVEYIWKYNVRFSAEYIRTNGFSPLMNITSPGVSVRRAHEDVLLFGFTVNI